ncbi:MAG TPA: hypothetical protein VH877_07220 [Polyangia bacterium]|jgi:hypothetical protein|nr:hypothetical protein [Polyangia bacterium]
MMRLHLLGAIGLFTLGLGGAAHAEGGYVNDPQYAGVYDDGATYQEAPCDGAQPSSNYYAPAGGQTYVYNGQAYQYAPYNGYGYQPSYNYVPVRRPYYNGGYWQRPWRRHHGYRVFVPPPARW